MSIKELVCVSDDSGGKRYKFPEKFNRFYVPLSNIKEEYIKLCYDFAFKMAISKEGHHRSNRAGGSIKRKEVDVFFDTFYGKLGEFACYQYMNEKGILLDQPDMRVMGENQWDEVDFVYKDRKIEVKVTSFRGNLLLLEKENWNEKAEYQPNENIESIRYDDFLFVRISPYTSQRDRIKLSYKSKEDQLEYLNKLKDNNYSFDIHYTPFILVQEAIKRDMIIEEGSYLNTTPMDATNYYVQTGDMSKIKEYIQILD